ncbi:FAD-dependent 5-carboxymethylaminomethyl-2-thiouridine(34) oxidoreductase MnmC [Aliidiomarina soli]|uniref:tRNA 5-methylaminomethyl-2-thiouridine biosynthesis bifunctional protein MnmC n=1 Tax=Aliidiomarina soli TaxID=1928574 RepID=A0A432WL59_9GAMM|nr:FAD-dependent 5-carboxymethylaminomethyl-2-thiouridine(34) oxidoreductase MnmC [Aliidiomarina soli]RUO34471.1 bifunctional tRNA (5-methylaminomethyl-2-thiouridine)(34)-methyltransferase MnmD/FAD-dependent 5-carboxymethylaminomethyl-2-thiouridine(34) oxidoreductase MnmC [Aliidiomarina soli]
MSHSIQPAAIHFNQSGMPISDLFDDIYFSNQDGLAESHYVFLQGNRLPERFRNLPASTPFVVAETGFGSGLNMLLTAFEFLRHAPADAHLHLVSFERYPMTSASIRQALQHWPQLRTLVEQLVACYPPLVRGCHRLNLHPRITLDLHFGEILDALPAWQVANPKVVNAWYLDGFAPSKNPQMWQPDLYQAMAAAAADTCTLATFTSVGQVRRGLQDAGFAMRKQKGFGHKREMLVGSRVQPQSPKPRAVQKKSAPQTIAVIGGGIAAASMVQQLKAYRQRFGRGDKDSLKIILLCQDTTLAAGASGNAQGAVYPLLQADFTPTTEFYTQAFVYARQFYQQHAPSLCHWSGVLQLAFNDKMATRQHHSMQRSYYPADFATLVDATQASAISGIQCCHGGLWLPSAGWLNPARLVEQLISEAVDELHLNTRVEHVEKQQAGFSIETSQGTMHADQVIWASGANLQQLNDNQLDIRPAAGQVTQIKATVATAPLKAVICHKGYLTPADSGQHCLGATFTKLASGETDYQPHADHDAENIALSERYLPLAITESDCVAARASVRATTADHLPLVGPLPYAPPGVWVLGGLGSRGFTSAPWCARHLVDRIFGLPGATTNRVQRAIDSNRLLHRAQASPARARSLR